MLQIPMGSSLTSLFICMLMGPSLHGGSSIKSSISTVDFAERDFLPPLPPPLVHHIQNLHGPDPC